MRLTGAASAYDVQGEAKRRDITHYYLRQTQTYPNVPHFDRVRAAAVYPGIDWVWHGASDLIEYDFVVAPGADSGQIRLAFTGAMPRLENGDLVLATAACLLRHKGPVAYQEIDGRRVTVPAAYRLSQAGLSFTLGAYDHQRQLVIDPSIAFSSFAGGALANSTNDFHALLSSPARIACSTVSTAGGGSQTVLTRFDGPPTTTAVFGSAAPLTPELFWNSLVPNASPLYLVVGGNTATLLLGGEITASGLATIGLYDVIFQVRYELYDDDPFDVLGVLRDDVLSIGGDTLFVPYQITVEADATPIPEPSTLILGAVGLLCLGLKRRCSRDRMTPAQHDR